jgi:signal transduction histidine kinase
MPVLPLRAAMFEYGLRILYLSAVISAVTAGLLFLAVRRFLVAPISRVISHIKAYEAAPEDARLIIEPSASIRELREAEAALHSMQVQLSGSLRQKDRLAALGGAVAKISHDLRNMLTTAQLLADRMEESEDPAVKRTAPKLVGSLSRAVSLCEGTLAFGRAEEPAPRLSEVALARLVEDVFEGERLALEGAGGGVAVDLAADLPPGATLRADAEQLYRVLANLVRNARQAIEAADRPGRVTVRAEEGPEAWRITVSDTGPGLPAKAAENLFKPFQGRASKGGSGLGLAIAAELVRLHGGRLDLLETSEAGTSFAICLPKP